MFAICAANGLEEFQAPKSTLLTRGPVTKGPEPKAKKGRRKSVQNMANSLNNLHLKIRKHSLGLSQKRPLKLPKANPKKERRHDASSTFTAKADLKNIDLKDSLPLKQGLKPDIRGELVALLAHVSPINSQLAKLKVLDVIPTILGIVVALLDMFTDVISSASQRASDSSVPLAGQAGPRPVEGDKNTNQSIITRLFQRRQDKDDADINLNKQPSTKPVITAPTTTSIPQIITTTTLIIPTTPSF
nr:hypothetical protein [Tanacetum cinerariifolium]